MFDASEAGEHLSWALNVVTPLPDMPEKSRVLEVLRTSEERLRDPFLHLALMGEFSSGKSTMLNALMGEELFPTSVLPTTTAITEIRPAARRGLRLHFHDGSQVAWREDEDLASSALFQALSELAPDTEPTLKSVLRAACADMRVSSALTGQELQHPSHVLGGDVVLYDTPGSNDDDTRSALTTRHVINRCDVAAIIVRADIPVSESLITFIGPILSRLGPSRVLFIVTWIDAVAPEERSRALSAIRRRLSRRLGVTNPAVVELAPKAYLASLTRHAVLAETKEAADHFARRVAGLRDELAQSRSFQISQRAIEATSELLESVDQTLARQERLLNEDARRLDDVVIEEMGVLRAMLMSQYRSALAATWPTFVNRLLAAADRIVSGIERDVQEALGECQTRSALSACLETELADLVSRRLGDILKLFEKRRDRLVALLRAAVDPVTEQLTATYSPLLALPGAPQPPPLSPVTPELPSLDLSAVRAHLAGSRRRMATAKGSGAVVGAGIGTLMAPGFGTVIGAAAGTWLGSAFGPSLGSMRQQAQAAAAQIVGVDCRQGVRDSLVVSLDQIREDAESNVEAMLAAFHLEYGAMITALQKKQAASARRVRTQLKQAELNRRQLSARRQNVEAIRHQLLGQPFLAVESQ
jgi:GTPase Era involved in 16S rRNA processing